MATPPSLPRRYADVVLARRPSPSLTNQRAEVLPSLPSTSPRSSVASPDRRSRAPFLLAAAEQRRLRPNINTLELRSDRLGTLVRSLSRKLSSSRSWDSNVTGHRGRSYLSSGLEGIDHPAIPSSPAPLAVALRPAARSGCASPHTPVYTASNGL